MIDNISEFLFFTFRQAFNFMRPNLSNYQQFNKSLSRQIQVKDDNNVQYSFDLELDKLIKNNLEKFGINGKIYSEESGFFNLGNNIYRAVYDPFCNSSLATRTFQEAAVGISIFSFDYQFITSAIMDYQTGIVALVVGEKTKFFQIQDRSELLFEKQKPKFLEESSVVITLENRRERSKLNKRLELLNRAQRVFISSGHIYWLKLACGFIDAYLDPFGGEKLYEIFACTVAQYSGCVVSDREGAIFNPTEYLKVFETAQDYLYYPVAATSQELHHQVLGSLD